VATRILPFAEKAIYTGLRKLWEINPALGNLALKRAQETSVKFFCDTRYGEVDYAAQTQYPLLSAIGLRMRTSSIRIGVDTARYLTLAAFDTRGRYGLLGPPGSPKREFADKFASNAFFHEFLHALHIKNQDTETHNLGAHGGRRNGELDLVYACSAQAFPSRYIHADMGTLQRYGNSYLACLTCASAVPIRGEIQNSCEPSDLTHAHEICAPILANPELSHISDAQWQTIIDFEE
jgi:hypothetical protein